MIEPLTTGREFIEWAELIVGTSEVCDCQVIVCPNLIIRITGRVQTLELGSLSSSQVLANPSTNGLAGKRLITMRTNSGYP